MIAETKNLRPGWKPYRFDKIAENIAVRANPANVTSDVYVGLEHLDPETIHLRRWGHPSDVSGDKLEFKKGDVIFGRRRAYQRKLALADRDGICSAHAMVLRARPDVIRPDFLPFFIQSDTFMDRAISISVGSLSPTVNWKTLAVQEFSLPPLEEQKRMAEILWAADEAVNSYSQAYASLFQAKANIVKSFCEYDLLNKNGKKWSTVPLVETCIFFDEKRKPLKSSDRKKIQGQYPYYGASGIIDWVNDYIFDDEFILLGEDGANIVDRSSPLAFKVDGKIWVNNHAHVIKPKSNMNIDFLVNYLESISYRSYTTGTAQPKITKSSCQKIPVPLPPLEKQKEIAHIFNSLDFNADMMKKTIVHLKQVSSYLINKWNNNV